MKWYNCASYILGIVACISKIIIADNSDVRIWAAISLIWVLVALGNDNNNRNKGNQHSINY